MSLLKKIADYLFGEKPKSGFMIQSVNFHTHQKDVTPEGAKWREVETAESYMEVVLVSNGQPNLSELNTAIKSGSVVEIKTVWIGNNKQTLSPDVKEKTK